MTRDRAVLAEAVDIFVRLALDVDARGVSSGATARGACSVKAIANAPSPMADEPMNIHA